jgi:hypothetical protein
VPDEARSRQLVVTLSKLAAEHWKLFQVATVERFAVVMAAGAGDGETTS